MAVAIGRSTRGASRGTGATPASTSRRRSRAASSMALRTNVVRFFSGPAGGDEVALVPKGQRAVEPRRQAFLVLSHHPGPCSSESGQPILSVPLGRSVLDVSRRARNRARRRRRIVEASSEDVRLQHSQLTLYRSRSNLHDVVIYTTDERSRSKRSRFARSHRASSSLHPPCSTRPASEA
jgi:hypothetical protein